ncbi:MAG: DUF4405 domain-containing protein [Candidatus Aminicenantes bacterium]|jgi:hypothetical protein
MEKRKFRFRSFTALMILWSFVLETVSGLVLYIVPPGRIAHWTNWKLWGYTKEEWAAIHTIFGYVFLIFALVHIYYNWKPILNYIRSKVKAGLRMRAELAVSLLITLVVFVATVVSLPPFSTVMDIGESFKNSWEESQNEPFVPHAELMRFDEFVEEIGISDEQAFQTLESAGITVRERKEIIKEIAEENGVAPSEIHDILVKSLSKEEKEKLLKTAKPQSRGGFGAMSLEQVAGEINMSVEDAIAILGSKGITAKKEDSIRTIAMNCGKRPFEIVNILRDAKK